MSKVHIPKQYFVALKSSGLAFITPEGTDTAAEKRKDTAKTWAKGYHWEQESNPKPTFYNISNTPQSGFKLVKQVTRWTTSNVAWRVLDPRGFEIEVYSGNLMEILMSGSINQGNIDGFFVYGRDGAKNVLVKLGTQAHTDATRNTQARKKAAGRQYLKMSDVNVGDKVRLIRYGEAVDLIYAGYLYSLRTSEQYGTYTPHIGHSINRHLGISEVKNHVFLSDRKRASYSTIEEIGRPNVVSILKENASPNVHKLLYFYLKDKEEFFTKRSKESSGKGWAANSIEHVYRMAETKQELQEIIDHEG